MNINTVFIKARKQLENEIDQKEQQGSNSDQEELALKMLDLYTRTDFYKTICYENMARAIEETGLVEGSTIKHTIGTNIETQKEADLECWECGSYVFNILDTDYVEIYDQTSYCVECVLCGARKWVRLVNPKFTQIEHKPVDEEYETEEYEEEEIECEQ